MTWRGHTWEFVISTISWIVALGALIFVVAYVTYDAYKTRRRTRKRGAS